MRRARCRLMSISISMPLCLSMLYSRRSCPHRNTTAAVVLGPNQGHGGGQ